MGMGPQILIKAVLIAICSMRTWLAKLCLPKPVLAGLNRLVMGIVQVTKGNAA